jgi:hypothetical protein
MTGARKPQQRVLAEIGRLRTSVEGLQTTVRDMVDGLQHEVRHMGVRIGAVELILSGQRITEVNMNAEIERLKLRVARVERRLELTDPDE